jgi:succinyl-diaminopimelate desuccinylase
MLGFDTFDEIDRWIADHEEEFVEDMRSLIRIPSVSVTGDKTFVYGKGCKDAADRMIEIAKTYGFKATDCGGRCVKVSYGEYADGKPDVEIWGHLDVVPEGDGWKYPPYECTRIGDYLIGRGIGDNKGPLMIVLYSMRWLKEHGVNLTYNLSQLCGLAEETGMEDASWYLSQYPAPDFAFISDCRFPLCHGEKGRCTMTFISDGVLNDLLELEAGIVVNSVAETATALLKGNHEINTRITEFYPITSDAVYAETEYTDGNTKVTVHGIAGHAAAPEKCINPVGILAGLLNRCDSLSARTRTFMAFLESACRDGYGTGLGIACEDPVFDRMTCAGTLLRLDDGGIRLSFDMRYPPSLPIGETLDAADREARRFGFHLESSHHRDGYYQDPETPQIQALIKAYETVRKDGAKPYVMGGNTYAGLFPHAVAFGPAIPSDYSALNLPPGHGGGHACDEVQLLSSFRQAIKIYILALQNLNEVMQP